jgi:SEC-C motif-containing protein
MKISVNEKCPCGSGDKYKKCCQKFHKGALPKTALLLMKSRYSAYAVGNVEYIIKTTDKNNSDYKEDSKLWAKEIESFCTNTQFLSLNIIDFIDGDAEAYVTFKANLKIAKDDASFVEKSRFLKHDGRWYYHSAKIT